MSLLLTVIGAGMGVGAAGFSRSRRSKAAAKRLGRAVRRTDQAPESRSTGLVERLDERYQDWVQKRLDPMIVGRTRTDQMARLSGRESRVLSAEERRGNRNLALSLSASVLTGTSYLAHLPWLLPGVWGIALYAMWPLLQQSWYLAVHERRFSLLHLLVLYLGAMWLGGYFLIGSLGLILIALNRKLELLSQTVTRTQLTQLFGEQPQRVWVLMDGVEVEIPFTRLGAGHVLVLNAGQPIPVDGVVVAGAAVVDQHRLTGESQPVDKSVGDPVLAATLVLAGRLQVRVEKTGSETVAAKIALVLDDTVRRQQVRFSDQFRRLEKTKWVMLPAGALGWVVGGPTAMAAMFGCNYLMSLIPLRLLTLLNGLKSAAERGLLIKDGRALERLPGVDTIVFDKTGTLTLEVPTVAAVHPVSGWDAHAVLTYAAAAEAHQSHPIAQAIVAEAARLGLALPALGHAAVEVGRGLTADISGSRVSVGSERFLRELGLDPGDDLDETRGRVSALGHTLVYVALDQAVIGAVELAAGLRPEAAETVAWLAGLGLKRYILSGDQDAPTRALTEALGLDDCFANVLPAQKAERIKALQQQGARVCFIGDGINDAIALRQADVSISLSGATTVATDAAQIVLMDNDLRQMRLLWALASGFELSLNENARLARRFSLGAAGWVLLFPFKFLAVELFWGAQALNGMRIASRPLLDQDEDDRRTQDSGEQPLPAPASSSAPQQR